MFQLWSERDGATIFLICGLSRSRNAACSPCFDSPCYRRITNSFWTRLCSERTIALLPLHLDELWAVEVGSDPKRLRFLPDEKTLSSRSWFTAKLGHKFVLRKVRLVDRKDGKHQSSFKNRSNCIYPPFVEFVQEGDAREEAIKGYYTSLLCQGLAKIKNYSFHHSKIGILWRFTNSTSMIDLKLIGVASTTASTPDFEAAFDGIAFHRLPKHGSTFKLHHGFVYTLQTGRPAKLTKLPIEYVHQQSDLMNRIILHLQLFILV